MGNVLYETSDTKDEKVVKGRRVNTSVAVDTVPEVTRRPVAGKHRAKPKVKQTPQKTRGKHKAPAPVTDPVNLEVFAKRTGQHRAPTDNGKTILAATTGGILLAAVTAGASVAANPIVAQGKKPKSEKVDTNQTKIIYTEQEEDILEYFASDIKANANAKVKTEKPVVKTVPKQVTQIPPKPAQPPVVAETPAPVSAPIVAKPAPQPIKPVAPAVPAGSVWDQLAACESSNNWAINTGNGYYGGLQFSLPTWYGFGGVGNPANATREEQIAVAQKVLATQGWNAWPACSAKLGLHGINPNATPVIVNKKPVQVAKPAPAPAPRAPKHVAPSGRSAIIASSALGQVGWAQDCTKLATNALAAAGINHHGWPHTYLGLGRQVTAAEAIPGDLIYYANGGMGLAHIAVYVGGGKAVHGGWNGNSTVIFSSNVGSGPVFIRV